MSHNYLLRLKHTICSCNTTRLEPRHSYRTRRQARAMEAEFNERIESMERLQRELQEQLSKSQQEIRDLMVRSREESLEQRDQMAKMMEMMSALVKGKGPMQNSDVMEPRSRIHHDQDPFYPPGFTPPPAYTIQRGYTQEEPTGLEHRPMPPAPPTNLGQGMLASNPGASPANPLVPDLDDPTEVAKLKLDNHDAKYRSLEERLKAIEGTEVFSALGAKELSLVPNLILPPKFKVPDFEKYDGTRCPKAHLIMFCRKMTGYVNEDKLLIHCFQDSLTGSALRWYNQLSREKIRS